MEINKYGSFPLQIHTHTLKTTVIQVTDLQGWAFLETTKAIYRHLLKCMDQNCLLRHPGHPVSTTRFLYVKHSASKRERVFQQSPMHRGKTFCRAICVLPRLEPGPCYHSIIYKSLKTSANSASWLRLQELLC